MTTAKRVFGTKTQCIGSGDSYVTLSGTTESFGSDVDLETNGYEGAQVEIEVKFDASPTDDVEFAVYPKLEGTYDGQEIAITGGQIEKVSDDSKFLPIIILNLLHFRLGVKQTGSTDSHDVRAYVQPWRWDIS